MEYPPDCPSMMHHPVLSTMKTCPNSCILMTICEEEELSNDLPRSYEMKELFDRGRQTSYEN
jgi:hypothetical protein